jgi:hypothetical protein
VDINDVKRMLYASDNYIWLGPGEQRGMTIHVCWRVPVQAHPVTLSAEAWNAPSQHHPITL